MGDSKRTARAGKIAALVGATAAGLLFFGTGSADADGLFTVHEETNVCRDVATHGVGLASGSGTLVVPPGPGPVVAAYLEWVGADDETPDLKTIRPAADSTLQVNGVDVAGIQASGEAGAAELHPGEWWFSWHANIGPTGYDLMNSETETSLEITGWDTDDGHEVNRNGAILTVLYDLSPCDEPVDIEVLSGVDFFYSGFGRPVSSTIVAPTTESQYPSIANVVLSHWGTDSRTGFCRTMALWSLAGSGEEPNPSELPLITPPPVDGEASSANGSVEILQNPFFNPDATCDQEINPVPDAPYEPGHPNPEGAATAPYRLLSVTPDDGGYLGPQTSLIELELLVPAATTWVAFQLESEGFNIGESGAWGGGFRILSRPAAAIGDRVWIDYNKNGLQDGDEAGLPGVEVRLLDAEDLSVRKETTTEDDGTYLFAGDPGCFVVEFDLPDGHSFSPSNVGGDREVDSNIITSTSTYGRSEPICVELDGFDYTIDAGVIPPELSSLGDRVWDDKNRNGVQDPDEPGVAGVVAKLVDAQGEIIATTTTDAKGYYRFDDLEPGQYRVVFRVPSGFDPAPVAAGSDDELDSDASVALFDARPPKPRKEHDDNRDGTKHTTPDETEADADAEVTAKLEIDSGTDPGSEVWIGSRWIEAEPGVSYTNLDAGLIVLQQVTTTTSTSTTTTTLVSTTQTTEATTSTTQPPTTTSPTTAATTTTEAPERLAFTGSESATLVALGVLLLGNGLSLHGLHHQTRLLRAGRRQ